MRVDNRICIRTCGLLIEMLDISLRVCVQHVACEHTTNKDGRGKQYDE
tara:strand:- start:83 stop:226 length:144 start_codon:yes stop_codon:yes gene_type:complete